MEKFSENLKLRRKRFGWSQIDLAFHSGVSERAIAGYERGEREKKTGKLILPRGAILQKLAVALKCSPGWLMGDEQTPMQLREGEESEADLWRRRAKAAEQQLADLRDGLKELLNSSASKPDSAEVKMDPSFCEPPFAGEAPADEKVLPPQAVVRYPNPRPSKL